MVEVAWLIELMDTSNNDRLTSLCLGLAECRCPKFGTPNQAIRFCREEDAKAYIDVHVPASIRPHVKATEHSWS